MFGQAIKRNLILRRTLVIILALAMILAALPAGAFAAGEDSVTVTIRFYDGGNTQFLLDKTELTIDAGLAQTYGYKTERLTNHASEVTAYDALVKIHEVLLGTAFDSDTAAELLGISDVGMINKVFGEDTSTISFLVNNRMPYDPDSEYSPSMGYTGYTADDAVLEDGDDICFFLYQDTGMYMDYNAWFEQAGERVDELTVSVGESVDLKLRGYSAMYYGFMKDEVIVQRTEALGDVSIHSGLDDGSDAMIDFGSKAAGTTDDDGNVSLTFTKPGTYVVTAFGDVITEFSFDEYTSVVAPWLVVTVEPYFTLTVPSAAEVFFGQKDGSKHYVPFIELEPIADPVIADGKATYTYECTANSYYNYRVSGEGMVTYGNKFQYGKVEPAAEVTAAQLTAHEPDEIDRDLSSNSGYNVADVYLNINPQNYLRLDAIGEKFQIVSLRNWEAVDTITNNYFIEPDYHFTVLNERGAVSSDVVTVDAGGMLTAVGEGMAIVLVTYDAITVYDDFYGAIWPENTGVFVVTVGADESELDTGMTLHEANTEANKLAGEMVDAEHDVFYYNAASDGALYTFTPTAGSSVSILRPTLANDELSYSGGFTATGVTEAAGTFTVRLTEGRNIVKVTNGEAEEYQVLTAKPVTITVSNLTDPGAAIEGGDKVKLSFDTVYHPANKLAGVYNMNATLKYTNPAGGTVYGTSNQYRFASTAAAQTIELTVPADATGTYTLTDGTVFVGAPVRNGVVNPFGGWGDPYGGHRDITYSVGKNPNFNASARAADLSSLPDIAIQLGVDSFAPTLSLTSVERTAVTDGKVVFKTDEAGKYYYRLIDRGAAAPSYSTTEADWTDAPAAEDITLSFDELTVGAKDVYVWVKDAVGNVSTPLVAKLDYPTIDVNLRIEGLTGNMFYKTVAVPSFSEITALDVLTMADQLNSELTLTIEGDDGDETLTAVNGLTAGSATESAGWLARIDGVEPGVGISSATVAAGQELLIYYGENTILYPTVDSSKLNSDRQLTFTTSYDTSARSVTTVPLDDMKVIWGYGQNRTATYTTDANGMITISAAHMNNGKHSVQIEKTAENGLPQVVRLAPDYSLSVSGQNSVGGSTGGSSVSGSVSFTLRGDSRHDEGEHDAFETWISRTSVSIASGDTVGDVFKMVLDANGYSYDGLSGNYIESITTPDGATLGEFDNGPNSGWMYTVNGSHPIVGLNDYVLTGGDNVVFHYTDDWTKESDAAAIAGGGGGSGATTTADGILTVGAGGRVTPNDLSSYIGNSVTLTITPNSGYVIKDVMIDGRSVGAVGEYTISRLTEDTRIVITFEQITAPSGGFTDVPAGHWAAEYINALATAEVIEGKGNNLFAPNDSVTRAEFVTILARMSGEALGVATQTFTDVPTDFWAARAVTWAVNAKITSGLSATEFAPNREISREEMAVMLVRYAEYKSIEIPATEAAIAFADAALISEWATDAVATMQRAGIIGGKENNMFAPQDSATRAEAAKMVYLLNALVK